MIISQINDMIQTGNGDRPQLVHRQGYIEKPSRWVQFATRLGLTKGVVVYQHQKQLTERCVENKPLMDAVEKAYAFVSGNYEQGDQVVLLINSYRYQDRYLDATEMLAQHLHNGTRPNDQSKNEGEIPPGQIPIHCVAVKCISGTVSISEWNDKLRLRFPPGIEHIICWAYSSDYQSCVTRCDMQGDITSREV
ncbi:unnamed protein product [Rhizoctonia solani]|nr:unnamed protein product [Rhizoctonia solani]